VNHDTWSISNLYPKDPVRKDPMVGKRHTSQRRHRVRVVWSSLSPVTSRTPQPEHDYTYGKSKPDFRARVQEAIAKYGEPEATR
jgi:hypothetical protein